MRKKPEHCVIKCKLRNILCNETSRAKLVSAVDNVNSVMDITSLFVRSFLVYIFENNIDVNIAHINSSFFRSAAGIIMNGYKSLADSASEQEKQLKAFFVKFSADTGIRSFNDAGIKIKNISFILGAEYDRGEAAQNLLCHYKQHTATL
jgi:hypothetical protein